MTSALSSWRLISDGAGAPAWNMAVDEALLREMPASNLPILRCYEWSEPAVSLGYFQDTAVVPTGRPYVRRYTGGGLVDHAADLTYTVVLPRSHSLAQLSVAESYRQLHVAVLDACQKLNSAVSLSPGCSEGPQEACFQRAVQFDVLHETTRQKIAGAAQRRTREGILHQGSILWPLLELEMEPAAIREKLRNAISISFSKTFELTWQPSELTPAERERATALTRTRYETSEWNAHPPHALRRQTA